MEWVGILAIRIEYDSSLAGCFVISNEMDFAAVIAADTTTDTFGRVLRGVAEWRAYEFCRGASEPDNLIGNLAKWLGTSSSAPSALQTTEELLLTRQETQYIREWLIMLDLRS